MIPLLGFGVIAACLIAAMILLLILTVQTRRMVHARPKVERYIRCSIEHGNFVVEPGIEARDGDNFESIERSLRGAGVAIAMVAAKVNDPLIAARSGEDRFSASWPGRAWFVEIHDRHLGRWTQSYLPYGMPRSPCE